MQPTPDNHTLLYLASSTPSLRSTPIRLCLIDNRVKWVLWSDLNQIKVLMNYALIFDDKGNNKFTVILSFDNHDLQLTSDPSDINIYGVKVINGSFPTINGQLSAETFANVRDIMGILLPGLIDYINNHPEIKI